MKITVKEVAVVKTGTSGKGDWELIKVTSDDGTGYTTFDKKAKQLNPGAVIDADVELKEGKASFKKFEIISNPEGGAASTNGGGYKKDLEGLKIEYQLKAQLQAIERASIEAQTAYNGAIKLLTDSKILQSTLPAGAPLLIEAALQWGILKLSPGPTIVVKYKEADGLISKVEPESTTTERILPLFKDGVELVNYAMKNGYALAKIKEVLSINKPTEIKDVPAAIAILYPDAKTKDPAEGLWEEIEKGK